MKKSTLKKIVCLGAIGTASAWIYKKYDTLKSMYRKVYIGKGDKLSYDEFEGEAVATMFSGVALDLSEAQFLEDEAYLDVYAFCSGVRIIVPEDVEVVLEGTNKMSGIESSLNEEIEKTKTLYLNYEAVMSGIQITDLNDEFQEEDYYYEEECIHEEVVDVFEETADEEDEEPVQKLDEETMEEELIEESAVEESKEV